MSQITTEQCISDGAPDKPSSNRRCMNSTPHSTSHMMTFMMTFMMTNLMTNMMTDMMPIMTIFLRRSRAGGKYRIPEELVPNCYLAVKRKSQEKSFSKRCRRRPRPSWTARRGDWSSCSPRRPGPGKPARGNFANYNGIEYVTTYSAEVR